MKTGAPPSIGGFLFMVGAAFGYAAGWNPYASDYTRYLDPRTRPMRVALWAGLGIFTSCVLLEVAGAAVVTAGGSQVDPSSFTAPPAHCDREADAARHLPRCGRRQRPEHLLGLDVVHVDRAQAAHPHRARGRRRFCWR